MTSAVVAGVAVGAFVVALAAGYGGGGPKAAGSVKVTVQSYVFGKTGPPKRRMRSYSLACNPVGGTLPHAARICADIARHPQPMLDPLPARTVCSGSPFTAEVTVTSTQKGKKTTFTASPDCDWPGGVGVAVYFDAVTNGMARYLGETERRLRCEDDPALLVTPTPWVSVEACRHNLWTPRTAKLIRIAGRAPRMRSLGASRLFPAQVGDRQCVIHGGGPAPGVTFHGLCEVTVKNVWSTPTVTFVESYTAGGRTLRSTFRVLIHGERVVSVHLSGSDPPQLWA